MSSNYWLKLYHEMLDDPKVMTLRPALRWRFVETLLVAGELDEGGYLPDLASYAWRVRDNPEIVETQFAELADAGLLSRDDGRWLVTKFAERQGAMSGAERMRRMREAARKSEYYGDETKSLHESDDAVTKRHTDKDKDIDKDIDTARVRPLVKAYCWRTDRPEPDLELTGALEYWLAPGAQILATAGGDEEAAVQLVSDTIDYMGENGLSYKNLASLVNVARTVWRNATTPDKDALLNDEIMPFVKRAKKWGEISGEAQAFVRQSGGASTLRQLDDKRIRIKYYQALKEAS